jgi:hypothetical protein
VPPPVAAKNTDAETALPTAPRRAGSSPLLCRQRRSQSRSKNRDHLQRANRGLNRLPKGGRDAPGHHVQLLSDNFKISNKGVSELEPKTHVVV